eukprot:6201280-Pleurochrysis_carterae.AAC.9
MPLRLQSSCTNALDGRTHVIEGGLRGLEQPETCMCAGQRGASQAPACAHALEEAYTWQITQRNKP